MKVVHISDLKNDNRLISPVEMLRQVADEIEAGERNVCKSALVILVDDEGGAGPFNVGFSMSMMRCSTAIAAMECLKINFLRLMGYGGDPT